MWVIWGGREMQIYIATRENESGGIDRYDIYICKFIITIIISLIENWIVKRWDGERERKKKGGRVIEKEVWRNHFVKK
jgi:hypothetical protein